MIEYDAENRQTAFGAGALADGQVLSTLYAYDGDGRRVLSTGPSGRTLFVYDALGRLAAEYSDDTTPMGGAHYLTADALGSVRVVTDDAARVVSRHDYLPFGEEIPATEGAARPSRTTAVPTPSATASPARNATAKAASTTSARGTSRGRWGGLPGRIPCSQAGTRPIRRAGTATRTPSTTL